MRFKHLSPEQRREIVARVRIRNDPDFFGYDCLFKYIDQLLEKHICECTRQWLYLPGEYCPDCGGLFKNQQSLEER